MKRRPHQGVPRKPRSAAIALVIAMLAALVFGIAPQGYAVDKFNCGQKYGIPQAAPREQLPGVGTPGKIPTHATGKYSYENPGEPLRGLKAPTPAQLQKYGTNTKKVTVGTAAHAYTARKRYLTDKQAEGKTPQPWDKWLKSYVPNQGNKNKGEAYEEWASKTMGLGGPDWECQDTENTSTGNRVFDAINRSMNVIYEFKSGTGIDDAQLEKDKEFLAKNPKYKIQYVFGRPPSKAAIRKLAAAGLNPPVTLRANPVVTNAYQPGKATAASSLMEPGGSQNPAGGALTDMVDASGTDQADANATSDAFQAEAQDSGAPDQAPADPGGIDFSTMQLRYVSDATGGIDYAFQANDNTTGQPSFGGMQDAQLASDSMFTWLALSPQTFWVNLNPDQPDRIVDPHLAKTDAGRVLLTSDLALKHLVSSLEVPGPNNPIGTQLMQQMHGSATEPPCTGTYRVWIEPDTATVRESGDQLYILDAPLKVELQRLVIKTPPATGKQCTLPQSTQDYNLGVTEKLLVPKAQQLVNTDPGFADLRRVYYSRVAAEWIRERDAAHPGAFHTIIDSGDVSRWPARTAWNPAKVYADYLKSYKDGDATFSIDYPINGVPEKVQYAVGGVDFTKSPHTLMSAKTFQSTYKNLPGTVSDARFAPVAYNDTDLTFLGGGVGKSSDTAQPPASDAQTGSDTVLSAPAQHNDDTGKLAHTGATIISYAVSATVLVVLGGTLMTFRRRLGATTRRK
ncbi:hypothetical protein ABH935_005508 [Catenulispora sp. GAS73]|uniref:hypothetical protein n=1 Tax=Catenulispora sp. GAS73 TaxID=3156269 RepID=UPI0035180479